MKVIMILTSLLVLIMETDLYCQAILLTGDDEIFIITANAENSSKVINYHFENATPTVWCTDEFYSSYWITSEYNSGNYQTTGSTAPGAFRGWDFCNSDEGDADAFGYGLFKISCDDSQTYCYLDYRDCNFPLNYNDVGYDLFIKYDDNSNDFFWSNSGYGGWTNISYGTKSIWSAKNKIQSITCFNPTPTGLNIANQNNHPYLTWQHSTDPNGTYYYEVWRLLTQYHSPIGTWELLTTISNKYYTDYDISIGDGSWGRAYYKIRAKIDDLFSGYSSNNYINFQGLQKDDTDELIENGKFNFNLFDNYPNPFNPTTKIKYSISEPTFVQLKVFDPFGKEVALLVNERKEEGIYQAEFIANNLSSGIYFYQLKTNNFISTKKMLIVK
jgi:hypothetical protein